MATRFGEKKDKTICVRLTEDQYYKLSQLAFLFDCSESEYIRILLDSIKLNLDGVGQNEDKETNSDD